MSDSLFDLAGAYKELYAMMTEEPDNEVINDTLDAVMGEIEVKGENYVGLINRLDMELDACKKHRDEWIARYNVRENALKRLKQRLAMGMEMIGKKEIKAGDNTIKLVKNGGKQPIIYSADVPKEYMKTTIIEDKDTEKIRKALESGKKLEFATLGERGNHISIK